MEIFVIVVMFHCTLIVWPMSSIFSPLFRLVSTHLFLSYVVSPCRGIQPRDIPTPVTGNSTIQTLILLSRCLDNSTISGPLNHVSVSLMEIFITARGISTLKPHCPHPASLPRCPLSALQECGKTTRLQTDCFDLALSDRRSAVTSREMSHPWNLGILVRL